MANSRKANSRLALLLSGLVAGMIGLSFASVPLYRIFCQVTGFGGTTQVAESLPATASERVMTIRFNADVDPSLPWSFQPEQREVTVKVGEQGLAFYDARNLGDHAITGTATFNVTPLKVGGYFTKTACFCFTEQRLAAGEQVDMGVSFFVDPAIQEDPNLDEVKTITLSYTFFPSREDEAVGESEVDKTAHAGAGSGAAAAAERGLN